MIPAQPQSKSCTKPKSEFEAFDEVVGKLLSVPKSAIKPVKKASKKQPKKS